MLVVLLEDDAEYPVLFREARRHIVKDVRQLHHKLVRLVQNLPLRKQHTHSHHQRRRTSTHITRHGPPTNSGAVVSL